MHIGSSGGGSIAESKEENSSSDEDDDFENENAALHAISYYVDNADESLSTEDIFNKFGHGVGSYVLVPADQNATKSDYYSVTLVVYTQNGFESFNVSLFEKKGTMQFRLDSKKLKKKDFSDMAQLIAYIEKKEKLIFSYAIPRMEVETAMQQHVTNNSGSTWGGTPGLGPGGSMVHGASVGYGNIGSMSVHPFSPGGGLGGELDNYPKARALYDYEAEVHGDLTLRAGDIIYITDREEEDGWWTGQIGNRSGLFPSTYVEVIEERAVPSIHRNEPVEGDVLVARYNYDEGGAEELAFHIGDRIVLQAKDESGWWLGKLQHNGVVGWFAPDLVAPLNDNSNGPLASPQNENAQNMSNGVENGSISKSNAAFSFDESGSLPQSLPSSPKKKVKS